MSMPNSPLVTARNVSKSFHVRDRGRLFGYKTIRVLHDFSLDIASGETVGLVGESGSGKTTAGRALLRLGGLSGGRVSFEGQDITALSERDLRPLRRRMQMIFQSPVASLNPRMTVGRNIEEALLVQNISATASERRERVQDLLRQVGLSAAYSTRFPQHLSGGQCQRIGIARALAGNPSFIVADEPVSALDVSIQAQVLNLLLDIKEQNSLSMLFVTHDLGVARHVSDRIVVLYLGRVMEIAPAAQLFASPAHPYTRALIAAAPIPIPGRQPVQILSGEIPSPAAPPSGCVFRTRCPLAGPDCAATVPALRDVGPNQQSACIRDL